MIAGITFDLETSTGSFADLTSASIFEADQGADSIACSRLTRLRLGHRISRRDPPACDAVGGNQAIDVQGSAWTLTTQPPAPMHDRRAR